MKKLITIFLSIALLAASSAVLYSCDNDSANTSEDDDDDKKKDKGTGTDDDEDGTKRPGIAYTETATAASRYDNDGYETEDESYFPKGPLVDFRNEYYKEIADVVIDVFGTGTGKDTAEVFASENSMMINLTVSGIDDLTDDQKEALAEKFENDFDKTGALDELVELIENEIDDEVPDELGSIYIFIDEEDGDGILSAGFYNYGVSVTVK